VKREAGDYIADIIDAIDKANKFIGNMSFEEFMLDDKTVFAVIRALEIVGEAAKNIPWELREKYPEIPWKDMTGMRDKLIHEYHGARLDLVWETLKEEIPPLKPEFEKILKGL
jgi:uncharacterized protein with HEPN domain